MVSQTQIQPRPLKRPVTGYSGRVVYIYAYDVAYEMMKLPITHLLGQPVVQFSFGSSKRNPRHLFFYRPQMVRLPATERIGPHGRVCVERAVKILPVGAISILVSVPFEVRSIEDLVVYHDLEFSNGILNQEVRYLAEEVRRELSPYFIKPVSEMAEEEAYTVFFIDSPLIAEDGNPLRTEDWFEEHRREVAALLTQETDVQQLSWQEAQESTNRYLSYYENDLAVFDWDAALLIEEPDQIEDYLYILELANLQLAELEAYDRILDRSLERSYRDLATRTRRASGDLMRELREIRIDLARFSDELSNITKFFGDWHLARIYENISSRFHLADWHHNVDEKIKTLDELYQILNQDRTNRLMLILEVTIVLLFVIDLILLVMGIHQP